jgi:plastocyanin
MKQLWSIALLGLVASGARAEAPPPLKVDPRLEEKVASLKQATSTLEKAGLVLARRQKSYAEQLFSIAELSLGAEALADLAPLFREGAPPRVTTPTTKLPADTPPQPKGAVGSSEEDEPAKKPGKGFLEGVLRVDGKPPTGSFGVITLEPVSGTFKARPAKERVMEQRGREFAPHVMAVSLGSTVTFPNFDPNFHNVFSTSDAAAFDLGLYKGGEARSFRFDREGVVRIGCNLHANMAAWIVVVKAPHYAITDDSGKFALGSLEPGKYTMRAWNEKSTTPVVQEVTLEAGKNTVEVGVKGDAPAGPIPDKFGTSRGRK